MNTLGGSVVYCHTHSGPNLFVVILTKAVLFIITHWKQFCLLSYTRRGSDVHSNSMMGNFVYYK